MTPLWQQALTDSWCCCLQAAEQEAKSRVSVLEQELWEAKDWAKRSAKDGKAMEAKLKLQLQDAKEALDAIKGEHEDDKAALRQQVHTCMQACMQHARQAGRLSLTSHTVVWLGVAGRWRCSGRTWQRSARGPPRCSLRPPRPPATTTPALGPWRVRTCS